ncbi:MAG: hypothetical protein JWP97_1417 [Labilithrix sp.]|nr:hypothetical protein [Labilithrix sp.]
MRKLGLLLASSLALLTGCTKGGPGATSAAAAASPGSEAAAIASDGPAPAADRPRPAANGLWIGASPEGDLLATGTRDTFLGVWVDVPEARPQARPPMELALVVDTSGSMAGSKIESARGAAAALVKSLHDGDIVTLDSFSSEAQVLVPPTRLDARSRSEILRQIALLVPQGSTNMFAGLNLAESQLAGAPASHTVRRVVMISDGRANVGPSTAEVLGAVAERGLQHRAQVTSFGVGVDYDEQTLDALSVRSNGRLYHIGEPRQMASVLESELALLDATLASDSFVEIVPAPGVTLVSADGLRTETRDGAMRIPLGALHAGQHREALVRVRINDPATFEGQTHSLASVRLRFRDAAEGDLERVQEVVARTQLSGDEGAVARSVSSRTKAIVAITEASRSQIQAAQRLSDGRFDEADKDLAKAEHALQAQAAVVTAPAEKKRLQVAAGRVAASRKTAQAMPAAPPAVQRENALRLNADGMHDVGF